MSPTDAQFCAYTLLAAISLASAAAWVLSKRGWM